MRKLLLAGAAFLALGSLTPVYAQNVTPTGMHVDGTCGTNTVNVLTLPNTVPGHITGGRATLSNMPANQVSMFVEALPNSAIVASGGADEVATGPTFGFPGFTGTFSTGGVPIAAHQVVWFVENCAPNGAKYSADVVWTWSTP